MSIFQNSVSFERPLAVCSVSCVPQETLQNVRKFKVAFSKVIRLLKKPQMILRLRGPRGLSSSGYSLMIIAILALRPPSAFAEGNHSEYENVEHQIAFMLSSGATVHLIVAAGDASHGVTGGGPAAPEGKGESATIAAETGSLLSAHFSSDKRFVLISAEPIGRLAEAQDKAEPDAAILARCAAKGATVVLLVSVERYEAGGGEMGESVARLIGVASAQELARDVVWTVVSSAGARSVFVNGARVE
jgi:hypothetical protein